MSSIEHALAYKVRQLGDDNIADAEKLHTAVYGVKLRLGFFARKYETGLTGVKHTGFIAYNNDGIPIAFYAVIPCFIRVDNQTVLSAQSADTMTHPDYRYKGLFVELALLTFDLCRSKGIRLLFGFPNQNSLPGFINKLDWQSIGRMDCFQILVEVSPSQKFWGKLPFLKNRLERNRKNELRKIALGQQGIPNSVLNDGFAGVYRDGSFLVYKAYNERYVIKIGASVLWIKAGGTLLIGDAEIKAEDFNTVMQELEKLATKLGLDEIQFHASPGTTLHRLFAANYKANPSFEVIFKDLGANASVEQIKFTSADIDTF